MDREYSHSIAFSVEGRPVSQGSMTLQKGGKVWHTQHGKGETVLQWRKRAQAFGKMAMQRNGLRGPQPGAVDVRLRAYFKRPPTTKDPENATTQLDLDKVCRAAGDALTGVVLEDDRQVCRWDAEKDWDAEERVTLIVSWRAPLQ